MNTEDTPRNARWIPYAIIFAVAWLVRLMVQVQLSDHPYFSFPLVDAAEYHDLAVRLATERGGLEKLTWQPWFYPLVLSWIYSLFGVSIWAAKLVQITVGSLTCVAVAALAGRLGTRRQAWVAGLLAALCGPLVFCDGELLAETWAGLWMVLTAWLVVRAGSAPRLPDGLALGALGALCLFTRPPLAAAWLVATAALALAWARAPARGPAGPWLGGLLIGFSIAAWPFLHTVQTTTGQMRLLPSSGGINFYLGNSADPCRTLNIRPGYQWEILNQWPATQGVHTDADREAFFLAQARHDIQANPAAWVRGLLVKATQFLSSRELPRNIDIYALRESSPLLALLVWKAGPVGFPFALLAGLWVLGLARLRGRPHVLWLMAAAYACAIMLVHVCDRYRWPVLPLLLPGAAGGALAVADQFRRRAIGPGLGSLGLLAGIAALTSAAGPFCTETLNYRSELDRLIATQAYEAGHFGLAETYARSALAHDPREPHALAQLGLVYARRGQLDEAVRWFEQAVAADPRMAPARFNLAKAAVLQKRPQDALRQFEAGLADMPGHVMARLDYGDVLWSVGETNRALAEYREALRLQPGLPPALQRIERTNRKPMVDTKRLGI